jgi:hypothetical protein
MGPVAPVGPTTPAVTIAKNIFSLLANPVVPVPPELIKVTGTSS